MASEAGGPLVTAQLGQRTTDSGLTLAVGYSRNRGIPEHWGWAANSVGGTGYVGPARYGDVSSAALSVPAGGGMLELLGGGGRSCTAESRSCTLTLDKAALQAAARYGLQAAKAGRALGDDDPIWPARLLFHHASTSDVVISGVLALDGGDTHEFSYTAKASAATAPRVAAYLTDDADEVLDAGQSARAAVGYTLPEDEVWSAASATGGAFAGFWAAEAQIDASAIRINGEAPETIQVLPALESGAVWRSYSAGGEDFEINAGDYLWNGADAPAVSYRYSAVPSFWTVDGYSGTLYTLGASRDQERALRGALSARTCGSPGRRRGRRRGTATWRWIGTGTTTRGARRRAR